MNKTLLENRKLAVLVMTAVIVLSIFGIGAAKVKNVGEAAIGYYNSEMAADFAARETAAESILLFGKEYGVSDALLAPAEQALQESRDSVGNPATRYYAGEQLYLSISLVYNALPAQQSGSIGGPAQTAWSEFTSRTAILSHTIPVYNELARTAGKEISGFPANIISGIADVNVKEMVA